MRSVFTTAMAALVAFGAVFVAVPAAEAAPCGWSKLKRTGYFRHCGSQLVLVKFHWSNGPTGTTCMGPGTRPFYPDGRHEVVKAYSVAKPPATMRNAQGKLICRAGQPSA